jgi:hypothetical protein
MAFVTDPCVQVMYIFRDRENTEGRIQVHFPPVSGAGGSLDFDLLEAEVVGTFGAWAPGATWSVVQALTDCPVVGASIGVTFHEDDPAASIGAGEAEMKGNFQFQDANGEFFTFTVPGILDSVLQPNGRYIDPTNAAVTDLVNAILDQTGDADIRTINNVVPVTLDEAWKSHRQSRKTGNRRTG